MASVAMARWTSTAMTPIVPLGMSLIRASPAAAPDLTPASGVQADKAAVRKRTKPNVIVLFMIGTSFRVSLNIPPLARRKAIPTGANFGPRVTGRSGYLPGRRFVIILWTRGRRHRARKESQHVASDPSAIVTVVLLLAIFAPAARPAEVPAVLGLKEQAAVYDGWLSKRLDKLLPELMRREKIDMWLVICQEYNEDPVYLSLVPFASLSARRLTMLVMFDRGGEKGVERFSVNRYGIGALFPTVWKGGEEDQWQALARAVKERDPKRIGIDESEIFAFGDGLSASLKRRLVQALGPDYAKRCVGAERLAVGWLERRLPEEIEVYHHIAAIAHAIIAEAFSPAVITPGITTTAEVEWWMWEKVRALGQTTWFNPSVSIQRPAASPYKDSPVIHRGDLLHCDFGIDYLKLNTDTQQHAYVLRAGETEAPAGIEGRDGPGQPPAGHPARGNEGGADGQRDPGRRSQAGQGRRLEAEHLHASSRLSRPRGRSDDRALGQAGGSPGGGRLSALL